MPLPRPIKKIKPIKFKLEVQESYNPLPPIEKVLERQRVKFDYLRKKQRISTLLDDSYGKRPSSIADQKDRRMIRKVRP